MVIAAIALAAIAGFTARAFKMSQVAAWLLGCAVVPIFVIFVEFLVPYQGGGASLWSVAVVLGGIYGAIASAVGTLLAKLVIHG